jgi:hypothetical protein
MRERRKVFFFETLNRRLDVFLRLEVIVLRTFWVPIPHGKGFNFGFMIDTNCIELCFECIEKIWISSGRETGRTIVLMEIDPVKYSV